MKEFLIICVFACLAFNNVESASIMRNKRDVVVPVVSELVKDEVAAKIVKDEVVVDKEKEVTTEVLEPVKAVPIAEVVVPIVTVDAVVKTTDEAVPVVDVPVPVVSIAAEPTKQAEIELAPVVEVTEKPMAVVTETATMKSEVIVKNVDTDDKVTLPVVSLPVVAVTNDKEVEVSSTTEAKTITVEVKKMAPSMEAIKTVSTVVDAEVPVKKESNIVIDVISNENVTPQKVVEMTEKPEEVVPVVAVPEKEPTVVYPTKATSIIPETKEEVVTEEVAVVVPVTMKETDNNTGESSQNVASAVEVSEKIAMVSDEVTVPVPVEFALSFVPAIDEPIKEIVVSNEMTPIVETPVETIKFFDPIVEVSKADSVDEKEVTPVIKIVLAETVKEIIPELNSVPIAQPADIKSVPIIEDITPFKDIEQEPIESVRGIELKQAASSTTPAPMAETTQNIFTQFAGNAQSFVNNIINPNGTSGNSGGAETTQSPNPFQQLAQGIGNVFRPPSLPNAANQPAPSNPLEGFVQNLQGFVQTLQGSTTPAPASDAVEVQETSVNAVEKPTA